MVAPPVPVAASVRVAGNFSGVVPGLSEAPDSPDSVAAKTAGVRAAAPATAAAVPMTPRRDRDRFLRWAGVGVGVGVGVRTRE